MTWVLLGVTTWTDPVNQIKSSQLTGDQRHGKYQSIYPQSFGWYAPSYICSLDLCGVKRGSMPASYADAWVWYPRGCQLADESKTYVVNVWVFFLYLFFYPPASFGLRRVLSLKLRVYARIHPLGVTTRSLGTNCGQLADESTVGGSENISGKFRQHAFFWRENHIKWKNLGATSLASVWWAPDNLPIKE